MTNEFDVRMTGRMVVAVLILSAAGFARPQSIQTTDNPSFAAYGDLPYQHQLSDGRTDEQVLIQDIAPRIKARQDIPFVIHFGDLGRPEFSCTDSWFEKTLQWWRKDLAKPVFYTPGDNDWKDCDRQKLKLRSSGLSRLTALRETFFNPSRMREYPAEWRVEQQQQQPENLTWFHRGVRFVTQHVISKDNGRKDVLLDDPVLAVQLAEQRDRNNLVWIDQAFELAAQPETKALVVTMQYDLFGPPNKQESMLERCTSKPAYREYCLHLQEAAARLNKPVLLVHGDTNAYCLDQPFNTALAPLLWRLNGPGDYKVIDASIVAIDAANPARPFYVTGLLSGTSPPATCDYSF